MPLKGEVGDIYIMKKIPILHVTDMALDGLWEAGREVKFVRNCGERAGKLASIFALEEIGGRPSIWIWNDCVERKKAQCLFKT
ncbi:MAG: hypothetical protein ACW99G_11295 [Candidatus Thorarchaeota archaeon]|jgi:hypothetical protein